MSSNTSRPADPARHHTAGGECLANLYPIGSLWVGKTRDGDPKQFKDFPQYQEYLAKTGCPDVSQQVAPVAEKEIQTPFTGFMEFKPADPYQQSLYSAMSSFWVGPDRTATELKMDSVWR
jgi:hypothetical protein